MGISIDLHSYSYDELCEKISDIAKGAIQEDRTAEYFIDNILPEFGVRAGDKFITLWNEYYEDYNSGAELMKAVDLYFGTQDTFLSGYDYEPHTNAYEALESLSIEPIGPVAEEEDY